MNNKHQVSSQYISDTSKQYAIYSCESRAIPRVTDGLKTSQRYALWVMRNKDAAIKTMAAAALTTYEKLYVHGDGSMNDAMSRLAAPYLNNICMLDGEGAFGSKLSPDVFGAPRYTHVRRSRAAQDIMYTDLDIVPMQENYDGSTASAATFLPIIPVVLLNGIAGIANGYSTEILPHAARDLIAACRLILQALPVPRIAPHWAHHDIAVQHIENNSWLLVGRHHVVNATTVRITELPPGVKLEKYKQEVLDVLEDAGSIKDYVDHSTGAVCIDVKMTREAVAALTASSAVDLFKLKSRVTERMVVVGFDGKMHVYATHHELISDFVAWRLQWYRRRYQMLLQTAQRDLAVCEALATCFADEICSVIMSFASKADVMQWIAQHTVQHGIADADIAAIAARPIHAWTQDAAAANAEKIRQLQLQVQQHVHMLAHDDAIKQQYLAELAQLAKKYA